MLIKTEGLCFPLQVATSSPEASRRFETPCQPEPFILPDSGKIRGPRNCHWSWERGSNSILTFHFPSDRC